MRVIEKKVLGTDERTGLTREVQIYSLLIDGEANGENGLITVKYQIALVSPTGVTMQVESKGVYTRHDRGETFKDVEVEQTPATYYEAGETMLDGNIAEGGEVKTPAVIVTETVQDRPANMKYTALEQSAIGIGIQQMLMLDLNNYPNLEQA